MAKLRFTKTKEFKHPNAKNLLDKQLKNEVLKKYGLMLGYDHPFNKVKEEKKTKDYEKIFIKKKGGDDGDTGDTGDKKKKKKKKK